MTEKSFYATPQIKVRVTTSVIQSRDSYKGSFATIQDLLAVSAFIGDYADVFETNTRWQYKNGAWVDTGNTIPINPAYVAADSVSVTTKPNSLVQRDDQGHVYFADPKALEQGATKGYVDNVDIKNKKYIDEKSTEVKKYVDDNAASSLEFVIDNSTFIITATLKNANGEILGTPQEVDLPFESVVVNGSYDGATKSIILTLQNGNTVSIPVSDLIDGLASKDELDKKLDVDSSTSEYVQLYAKDTSGQQYMKNLSSNAVADAVITRDTNGRAKVSDPDEPLDIANKNYVGNSLPAVISEDMVDSLF